MRFVAFALLLPFVCSAQLVPDVRAAIARDDFPAAEKLVGDFRRQNGVSPEMLVGHSWLGRGALAQKRFDQADKYAAETRRMALDLLKGRKLDDEDRLPIALGASIEVQAQVLAGKGQRSEGISFLKKELAAWHGTSMRSRIQKNIHLLSLVGTTPPPLEWNEYIGTKPPSLAALKGNAVLLFFWAHWCPDCKYESGVLAQLRDKYAAKGLMILGPTRYYGYTAGGVDATPEKEKPYIDKIRKEFYSGLTQMPVPLSSEIFNIYGASTTPTLVLLDRKGIVRMYHPGRMTYEELANEIEKVL
ncbi:MAG TPA: TlpA disulfide reductase family protein [Bryobacteraceae bacterium]|nr:TlpA disulfide reductase family protein [Bryobacteraceae bacterium]